MFLSKVVIRNFCSCENLDIPLDVYNPIVGYNNSGKSNILRAVCWLLKKSVLPRTSFFDEGQPIIVEGVIEGLNLQLLPANQSQALQPHLDGGNRLHFRRRQPSPTSTAAQVKIDVFSYAANAWVDNPAGLDTAIGVLFPEPLYIEAMEVADEDVGKFGAKNTIGLLLKEVLKQVSENNAAAVEAMNNALLQVSSCLNGEGRMDELKGFEAKATTSIQQFFPGMALHLNFNTPSIDDLVKSSTVSMSDMQGVPRPFTSFGHGAQRSAHMALIKLLADVTAAAGVNGGSTTVLLIDEPEVYLHPQAVELLREALVTLSNQNFQVVFSTHSPLLIGRRHVLETLMVYKDDAGRTVARNKMQAAAAAMAAHEHHAEALFSIQVASHLLFSEKVLLVEGKTEQTVLPTVYEVHRGHTYAHSKGCIVSGASSSALIPMMGILSSVGFAPKAVADLDFMFRVAPKAGFVNENSPDFVACKQWFAGQGTAIGIILDASGLPTRKGPNGQISAYSPAEAFELMAVAVPANVAALTQALKQHNIWVWSRGAIEAHLGIGKTDADRIGFVNVANANGNLNHAAQPQDLQDLVAWMS